MDSIYDYIQQLDATHPLTARGLAFWGAILVGFVCNAIAQFVIGRLLRFVMARKQITGTAETGRLMKLGRRLANLCFIGCVYAVLAYFNVNVILLDLLRKICLLMIVVCLTFASMHGLAFLEIWYDKQAGALDRPIRGGIQLAKIFIFVCTLILCVSILINKSPVFLLSGLGAAAAVLMLVFQDTILSLVSGLQLSANKLVRVGDWIEVPSEGVDGEVQEVALHTIKVLGWDNTIMALPVRKLTQECFINYRNMFESGGRRIMRSIYIDIHSIRFLNDDEIRNLKQFFPIDDYINAKNAEIESWKTAIATQGKHVANYRRITNIGAFRKYVECYLRSLPTVNQDLILLVRELQPESTGLPLQIYCFSAKTRWVEFEPVQADIMDHLLAFLPMFGLRVFQRSSDSAGLAGGMVSLAEIDKDK